MPQTKELAKPINGNELATVDNATLFSLVTNGDCSKLTDEQKLAYYKARCDAAGLDPRAQPFQFIPMNGKLVLYALRGATDQLASKNGVALEILSQVTEDGVRTVTVRAKAKDGRQTDEIGCVTVGSLKGDALCNAYMKAVTKAKRRAVLSICGLGMLDETELEAIPQAKDALPVQVQVEPPKKSVEKPKPKAVKVSATLKDGDEVEIDAVACRKCDGHAFTYMVWTEGTRKGDALLLCAAKDCKGRGKADKAVFVDWYDGVTAKIGGEAGLKLKG